MVIEQDTPTQLSLQQAADRLGFGLHRVELLAQSGHLQAKRCADSGEWQISLSSIKAFEGGRGQNL